MIPTEMDDEEAPLTMREKLPHVYPELRKISYLNGKNSVKMLESRQIAITPKFLVNALKNMNIPVNEDGI